MNFRELFTLDGKTALVTGAARGLGREISLGLGQYGASLVLADAVYPQETADLVEQSGMRCLAVQTDISDEGQVKDLTKMAGAEYRQVDVLVNNAGVSQLSYTATEELPVDEWDRIVEINLRGTFLCCKHIGKSMISYGGGGSIVNIASTAGITGVPRAPAYCVSKSGIILLTKSLALEWARHNIRVNSIAPHYLETDLTKGLRDSEKIHEAIVKQIPLRRFGKASEVVGAVLYLSSNASSYTTGTVIPVDGGYLAQ
jgi:NAD(P)-dependent dehydrogenase (short-subunit alcohol dehydrogenase family)